jgi:hypothetical protein
MEGALDGDWWGLKMLMKRWIGWRIVVTWGQADKRERLGGLILASFDDVHTPSMSAVRLARRFNLFRTLKIAKGERGERNPDIRLCKFWLKISVNFQPIAGFKWGNQSLTASPLFAALVVRKRLMCDAARMLRKIAIGIW